MDEIGQYKIRYVLCFVTGLIAGAVLGAAVLTMLVSYRVESYHKRITELDTLVEEKDIRLDQLEKAMNSRDKLILKEIEVDLGYNEEELEFDRITLEKYIKDKYKQLLGKEVKNIDSEMLAEVVDKRIFRLDHHEYKLKVTRIVLTQTLKLWIIVEPSD